MSLLFAMRFEALSASALSPSRTSVRLLRVSVRVWDGRKEEDEEEEQELPEEEESALDSIAAAFPAAAAAAPPCCSPCSNAALGTALLRALHAAKMSFLVLAIECLNCSATHSSSATFMSHMDLMHERRSRICALRSTVE